MILDSEAKLIDYETRRAKGENLPDVEVVNEQRRKEELEARKQALDEEIRRETKLLPSTPKILGVARVLPHPAADQSMRSDAQIEAIGMEVAMQYEREHGRSPEDVSAHNLGYDIRSTSPSGEVRYIEVITDRSSQNITTGADNDS
jgi:DNA gyrase inhibitor GyrI